MAATKERQSWKECLLCQEKRTLFALPLCHLLPLCGNTVALSLNKGKKAGFCVCVNNRRVAASKNGILKSTSFILK